MNLNIHRQNQKSLPIPWVCKTRIFHSMSMSFLMFCSTWRKFNIIFVCIFVSSIIVRIITRTSQSRWKYKSKNHKKFNQIHDENKIHLWKLIIHSIYLLDLRMLSLFTVLKFMKPGIALWAQNIYHLSLVVKWCSMKIEIRIRRNFWSLTLTITSCQKLQSLLCSKQYNSSSIC